MTVAILDTETTDNDPKMCQPIEVAIRYIKSAVPLDIEPRGQATAEHLFLQPSIPITWGAMATHNIVPSDLIGAMPAEEYMVPDGIDYVIAHNVDFDAEVLGGMEGARRICTLAIARHLLPELDSHKQGALVYYFASREGLNLSDIRDELRNAHSAIADIKMCAYILEHLLELAYERGYAVNTWEEVWLVSELARIPTVMGFGKHKGIPIRNVDRGYIQWYRRQPDPDPYYLKAFELAGF